MAVVQSKGCKTLVVHCYIFYCLCYVTRDACNLITSKVLTKNAPGGDLVRVDLIRFPGSIPGDICMYTK